MNDETLELCDIGIRINDCFAFVKDTITAEELTKFRDYITTQEATAPFFSPIAYMSTVDKFPNIFTVAKQRADALNTVLDVETPK